MNFEKIHNFSSPILPRKPDRKTISKLVFQNIGTMRISHFLVGSMCSENTESLSTARTYDVEVPEAPVSTPIGYIKSFSFRGYGTRNIFRSYEYEPFERNIGER